MDDKIKEKAQEVRLALLNEAGSIACMLGDATESIQCRVDERTKALQDLASALNQLDPDGGMGGYGFARLDETKPTEQA